MQGEPGPPPSPLIASLPPPLLTATPQPAPASLTLGTPLLPTRGKSAQRPTDVMPDDQFDFLHRVAHTWSTQGSQR